jgi:IS5 family transposase
MVALLYLKHAYNESDESLVERWSQDVYSQYFSGLEYFEPQHPCEATQIGRFRTVIGQASVEEILKATIGKAVNSKATKPSEFERVIVGTPMQEKMVAFLTDSRMFEIARYQAAKAAKAAGISVEYALPARGYPLSQKGVTHRSGTFGGGRMIFAGPTIESQQVRQTRLLGPLTNVAHR